MLRTKVIEIKPSKHVCCLVNSVQYFLQISLKSSRFFFLEKYQETCACRNRIHKIQTCTGLYKSISVCLMTKKNLSDPFKQGFSLASAIGHSPKIVPDVREFAVQFGQFVRDDFQKCILYGNAQ